MLNEVEVSGKAVKLKSNYKVITKHDAFYTGGKVQFSSSEEVVFCSCSEKVQIVNVESGKVVQTISEENDVISCFAISPDDEILVTSSKNLLLKHWDWKNAKCVRSWKAINKGPISSMIFDSTSTLLATGSSDSTIKIWDVIKQYYTHNLKGSQGVVSLIHFHPDHEKLQLFSASDDCKIRIWDLNKSRCVSVLEGHYSVVTSLAFPDMESIMISSGRDNVINIWDLPNRKILKTIPSFQAIEAVLMLPADVKLPIDSSLENDKYFLTCGTKGILKIWSLGSRTCVFQQPVHKSLSVSSNIEECETHGDSVIQAALCQNIQAIAIVTADHNILLYSFDGLKQVKQFVGYNDEILDMKFLGSSDHHVVVATNSNQVRLYNLTTMDCQLLAGHSDIVLCLDVHHCGDLLVTGSKDNTVRIWKRQNSGDVTPVGLGKGHTHAVGCVAWSRTKRSFVVSGSQDLTIKVWSTKLEWKENEITKLGVHLTEKAHDKDINSIAVSPNDKLVATGSQDKTAKIWRSSDLVLLGTMRGHRRGVWCVQFSPIDQCLATGSGDSIIRLWALSDFTCLKTLEGHTNSVLQICFATRGMQLLSSGSDGLIKLWTIKTSECVKTMDEHEDKVWSLALTNSQETMVSGGADSVLNIWKDVTEEEEEQLRISTEEQLIKEQELLNLLHRKQFAKAVALALTLEQPLRTLNVLKDILVEENGKEELSKTLRDLRDDQVDIILRFLCNWNTNAKHSHVSQTVLSMILKQHSPTWLTDRPEMRERIEALLPYTERHFERMNRLLQQSMFVDYTWDAMKLSSSSEIDEKSSSEVAGCSLEKDGLDNAQINNQIIKTQVEDGVCTTEVLAVKDNEIQKEILTTDPEKENLSQVNCNENASTTEKKDEVQKTTVKKKKMSKQFPKGTRKSELSPKAKRRKEKSNTGIL